MIPDKEAIEYLDQIYVRKDECNERHTEVESKLSNDNARFAVLEYQQKINNWLTAAIASGIVALVIKVFAGA